VLAARYPAAVGLATLLIQPGWLTNATANQRSWRAAAAQIAAAIGVRCRLSDSAYRQLSRWNLDSTNHDVPTLQRAH
jgi:hypothetical protein